MRTFIAVDFSPKIINKITEIIKYFKTQTPQKAIKWVAPEHLHLTIKFLGDVPENKIDQIKGLIKATLNNENGSEIEVDGLGMYPNPHMPRVIWLGIEGTERLREIHNKLDTELQKADIPPDNRSFSPHLTIARIRRRADKETVKEIGETLSSFNVGSLGNCNINNIILYKSELTPEGPEYTALLSSPLNKV